MSTIPKFVRRPSVQSTTNFKFIVLSAHGQCRPTPSRACDSGGDELLTWVTLPADRSLPCHDLTERQRSQGKPRTPVSLRDTNPLASSVKVSMEKLSLFPTDKIQLAGKNGVGRIEGSTGRR
ncbi:hypothetical protein RRG08_044846 [Elysia crispata]|uniref:Uncharacterized protein n=1 Tax=Elysia crispata TaxID=231223 RepID=A0AAE1A4R2_9GAST|nr:hypothetical protein RRG08_044846 [Elysia crispata]